MPSPLRDRAFTLIHDIRSVFISEFSLLTPFLYDDVQPGERYGLISFEEFDMDQDLQAKEYFKVIRGEIILTFGYSSQDDAEISPVQVMFDLDNFRGALYQQLPSSQDLFFDFQIKGAMSRALRQPIRNPDVWISDVTASSVVRVGIRKTATGAHIP